MTGSGGLTPYVTPLGAWALAVGTSIGWGSMVVTSNSYLLQAGPLGSVLGMVIGAIIMIVISGNYHYMINYCPEAGGAYTYAREAFGHDQGFLTAWFLMLIYVAIFWANATSLPLFARYFLGETFQFGPLYSIFGYQVYFGEALLAAAFILLFAVICAESKRLAQILMICMVGLLAILIMVCFLVSIFRHSSDYSMGPSVIPEKNALTQVIRIACISPWAFIGFESISHSAEEFTFQITKTFKILLAAVIAATMLYLFVILLSVTAYPAEYGSWLEYIRDLDNISGIKGLPAFYAAYTYMGNTGVTFLLISLLALILTSLIGNMTALSRLVYALARDEIMPGRLSHLNRNATPSRAILYIAVISVFIPLLGRTAIGWIVDVTTIGATIIYGFVSASAWKLGRDRGNRAPVYTGAVGLILMIGMGLYLVLPDLFGNGAMARETFLLFAVWALLGFVFFRNVMYRDHERKFGKSVIVWIGLLGLIFFSSLVWMSDTIMTSIEEVISNIHNHFADQGQLSAGDVLEEQFLMEQIQHVLVTKTWTMVLIVLIVVVSLAMLLSNYIIINKRIEQSEAELFSIKNMANTDPLTGVKSKIAYAETEKSLQARLDAGHASEFAIVVCDVNGLKHVNDTRGHKAGDEYIRAASRMVCVLFQHSPVFRVGGDEFVALLTGMDYDRRDEIMKQLHDQSVDNIAREEVVVAGGIAEYLPGKDHDVHEIFERADQRMYQEKALLKSMGAKSR